LRNQKLIRKVLKIGTDLTHTLILIISAPPSFALTLTSSSALKLSSSSPSPSPLDLSPMANRAGQSRERGKIHRAREGQVAEIPTEQVTGCQNCFPCRPLFLNNWIDNKHTNNLV